MQYFQKSLLTLVTGIALLAVGCTTAELRSNTIAVSRTVSDIQADQVLYNLAIAYKAYCNDRGTWNEILAFVQLGAAGISVTDTGQVTVTPNWSHEPNTVASTFGLQGSRANADNWAVTPINDPTQLQRLYGLYKLQFPHTEDFKELFPTPPAAVNPDGKPTLIYIPIGGKWRPSEVPPNNVSGQSNRGSSAGSSPTSGEFIQSLQIQSTPAPSNSGTPGSTSVSPPAYGQAFKLIYKASGNNPTTEPLRYFDVYYIKPFV